MNTRCRSARRTARSTAIVAVMQVVLAVRTSVARAAEWSGVDETVVEKYAAQAGRSARTPFINTNQGDLLLFVFLLAGVIGGFVMGYYWRTLFKDIKKDPDKDV